MPVERVLRPPSRHQQRSASERPQSGFVLPIVMVIGVGTHLAVLPMLESARLESRATAMQGLAARSLADAERALQAARVRLETDLSFPTAGCNAGLCANLWAPSTETYDWTEGSTHQPVARVDNGGWWIERLGSISAGPTAGDCTGSTGGCEYVRIIASAAPFGARRTLEACYRIRRSGGLTPVVTRISWRQLRLP